MKGPVRPQMTHTGVPLLASPGEHDSGKVGVSDRWGEDLSVTGPQPRASFIRYAAW
jgi:hypothetical protein